MYARVLPIRCHPEHSQDFLSVYKTAVLPKLVVSQGFAGASLLAESEAGTGYLLSLWTGPDTLKGSEMESRKMTASMLLPFLTESPTPQSCEVLVSAGQRVGAPFARAITLPVPNEHIESARSVYEKEYLPLLKRQKGFWGVVWLVDRSCGQGWGISFWDTRQHMINADKNNGFFPKVLGRLAQYFLSSPVRGYHKVLSQV